MNDIISQLQQRRLILTASSGRCGTLLLSELLSLVPGVNAQHEPQPYVDNIYWRLKDKPELAKQWLIKYKLPAILNDIKTTNADIYIETSHMLCKKFFESILDLGIAFDLIILSRDLRATAMSFYALHDIPMRSKSGRRWLFNPDDAGNISNLPRPYSQYSDYQLVYWSVLEVELRKALYYKTWVDENQLVVKVDLKDLVIKSGFKTLLEELSLPEPTKQSWHDYKLLSMTKHNEKLSRKSFMRNRGFVKSYVEGAEKQEVTVREKIKYDEILDSIR